MLQLPKKIPQIWSINGSQLKLSFHPGQSRVWQSNRRFVAMLAGTQGGKTSFGPWWLWREILRNGSGDYLAITASFSLFQLKMLPVMREVFESILGIGRYWAGAGVIELADPSTGKFWADRSDSRMWGRIILRSAMSKGGLESTTALAAWLDEAGQSAFTQETWEAILRRLSLVQGRALITTTLYETQGWLKRLTDRWEAGDTNYDVIQFDSTQNPAFSKEEFERAKEEMADWRFELFYRGRFVKLPGQIYDLPDDQVVRPFPIPKHWPRYVGIDFGAINQALVWLAYDQHGERGRPDSYYIYRSSLSGNKTTEEHCLENLAYTRRVLPDGEIEILENVHGWYGGAPGEQQQRWDWNNYGIPVMRPAVSDIESGIDRVTKLLKQKRLFVFSDQTDLITDFRGYSREMDDQGNVFETIRDKNKYHKLDCVRYVISSVVPSNLVYAPNLYN